MSLPIFESHPPKKLRILLSFAADPSLLSLSLSLFVCCAGTKPLLRQRSSSPASSGRATRRPGRGRRLPSWPRSRTRPQAGGPPPRGAPSLGASAGRRRSGASRASAPSTALPETRAPPQERTFPASAPVARSVTHQINLSLSLSLFLLVRLSGCLLISSDPNFGKFLRSWPASIDRLIDVSRERADAVELEL